MPTVRVTVPLPFYLRLEGPFALPYSAICAEGQLPQLIDTEVRVSFVPKEWKNERSGRSFARTTVVVEVDVPGDFEEKSASHFAILNCREIVDRVVRTFVAVTRETQNAGFIGTLGTADLQLSAEIELDGADLRDRWPDASFSTLPLTEEQIDEFESCLTGERELPLDRLFIARTAISHERGDYPSAVVQAATAVELRTTKAVRLRLDEAGWSAAAIEPYERLNLRRKLEIPETDPRSLATYFGANNGFATSLSAAKEKLLPLRNRIVHRGQLPSREESYEAWKIADKFLLVVG